MPIDDLKERLLSLIDATTNEVLLEDLLVEAESRLNIKYPHLAEGLSEEDYEELTSLATESSETDTISYDELKSSLSRWFIK